MSVLAEIQFYAQTICAPLALLINVILIQLILYRSPKRLGVYKYLMICISLSEVFYALLDVLIAPDCYCFDTVFLVISQSPKLSTPSWTLLPLHLMFTSMFGVFMAMFSNHFVYRYLVITGSPFVKSLSPGKLSVWLLSPLLYGVAWAILIITLLGPNEYTDKVLR